ESILENIAWVGHKQNHLTSDIKESMSISNWQLTLPGGGRISGKKILEQYEGLLKEWSKVQNLPQMMAAACGEYDYWIKKQMEGVVVFGHTHEPMLKSYVNNNHRRCLYLNTGS